MPPASYLVHFTDIKLDTCLSFIEIDRSGRLEACALERSAPAVTASDHWNECALIAWGFVKKKASAR